MAQVKESFSPNAHLRGEIMRRWQQLSTSEIEQCWADRSKLIATLQDRYGYARGRAEKEVDLFYLEFQDRLRMAA
jgi:hypothetical protein